MLFHSYNKTKDTLSKNRWDCVCNALLGRAFSRSLRHLNGTWGQISHGQQGSLAPTHLISILRFNNYLREFLSTIQGTHLLIHCILKRSGSKASRSLCYSLFTCCPNPWYFIEQWSLLAPLTRWITLEMRQRKTAIVCIQVYFQKQHPQTSRSHLWRE